MSRPVRSLSIVPSTSNDVASASSDQASLLARCEEELDAALPRATWRNTLRRDAHQVRAIEAHDRPARAALVTLRSALIDAHVEALLYDARMRRALDAGELLHAERSPSPETLDAWEEAHAAVNWTVAGSALRSQAPAIGSQLRHPDMRISRAFLELASDDPTTIRAAALAEKRLAPRVLDAVPTNRARLVRLVWFNCLGGYPTTPDGSFRRLTAREIGCAVLLAGFGDAERAGSDAAVIAAEARAVAIELKRRGVDDTTAFWPVR